MRVCFPFLLGLPVLLALTACNSTQPAAISTPQPMQTVQHFHCGTNPRLGLDYLLFLPKGYDSKSSQRWPLLLFLHGSGERGADVWKVAVHGPPKLVAQQPDFPFVVVSPQCPAGEVW